MIMNKYYKGFKKGYKTSFQHVHQENKGKEPHKKHHPCDTTVSDDLENTEKDTLMRRYLSSLGSQ